MMHVAVIPDGNRRWARSRGLSLEEGYEAGIKKFAEFVKWSIELGITEITGWGMSYDNYRNRDREVLDSIKRIVNKYYEETKNRKDEIMTTYPILKDINLKVYGYFEELTDEEREYIELLNNQLNGEKYKVNILLFYNGRIEILSAVRKLVNSEKIDLDSLEKNLMLKSKPDIIIRTGGRIRTSGFLPIQSEYSEWFFLEKLWPDFTREDYIKILNEFQTRERNFGR
ncbi:MAG: polyprenyl diphosphate synthase [Candidatus Anstonellales archaeon]